MIKIIYMAIFVLIIVGCGNNLSTNTNKIRYLKVPSEFLTIQSAVDTENNGDVVLIDNGIYYENISIVNKSIVLTSNFHNSNLDSDINSTIIDGNSDTAILIDNNSDNTEITGLTIQNGDDGISPASKVVIKNYIIKNNIDGIDYEGGVCYNNTIINNKDDAIDLDGSIDVNISYNILNNNYDDGIEIRLHPYNNEILNIYIVDNIISNNGEDGVQLIGYNQLTNREFKIHTNLFFNNAMVAIGLMDNENTIENYEGAQLKEEVLIYNNTFINNNYSISGGSNSLVVNNIFKDNNVAIHNVLTSSLVNTNLYYGNDADLNNSVKVRAFKKYKT